MDRAHDGQAGPASGSRGGSSAEAARAAAAAAQAICRTLRGGGWLDAVALDWAAQNNASPAADQLAQMGLGAAGVTRMILAGAGSPPADGNGDGMTVLMVLASFCAKQAGAARAAAAGLLAHAPALLRSPDPEVALAAANWCLQAAGADGSARAALAREPDAAPAALALLCGTPPPWRAIEVQSLSVAANLVGMLAAAPAAAAEPAGGAPAGAGGPAAVPAPAVAVGVARMASLLSAALGDGGRGREGGGQGVNLRSAGRLLSGLHGLVGANPAAAAAARAAGALPLAARAAIAAQRAAEPDAAGVLLLALQCMSALAATGDLPALAARPDLIRALAGAVALAADGAPGGWTPALEGLAKTASMLVARLLAGGQGSSDAAADGFLAAGGAAHLVRRRARLSVLAGSARRAGGLQRGVHACGARTASPFVWAHCSMRACPAASPHPEQPLLLPPPIPPTNHRAGAAPVHPRPPQLCSRGRPRRHPHPGGAPLGPPRPAGGRRGGRRARRARGRRAGGGGGPRPPRRRAESRRRPGARARRARGAVEPAARCAAARAAGCARGRARRQVRGLRRVGAAGGRAAPEVLRLRRPRALVQQGVPARELERGPQGGVRGAAGRRRTLTLFGAMADAAAAATAAPLGGSDDLSSPQPVAYALQFWRSLSFVRRSRHSGPLGAAARRGRFLAAAQLGLTPCWVARRPADSKPAGPV
jgi:hypothetical protein